MKQKLLFFVLVVIAGGLSTIQAPVNAQLRIHFTKDFVLATLISYFTSGVLMVLFALINRAPKFRPGIKGTKWWHWGGGLVGALYVFLYTLSVARLGSAAATGVLILGQLFFGMLLDQYGLLELPKRKVTVQRLTGVALVLGGALLVFNF
jgi:transporter family-2 protein